MPSNNDNNIISSTVKEGRWRQPADAVLERDGAREFGQRRVGRQHRAPLLPRSAQARQLLQLVLLQAGRFYSFLP